MRRSSSLDRNRPSSRNYLKMFFHFISFSLGNVMETDLEFVLHLNVFFISEGVLSTLSLRRERSQALIRLFGILVAVLLNKMSNTFFTTLKHFVVS